MATKYDNLQETLVNMGDLSPVKKNIFDEAKKKLTRYSSDGQKERQTNIINRIEKIINSPEREV